MNNISLKYLKTLQSKLGLLSVIIGVWCLGAVIVLSIINNNSAPAYDTNDVELTEQYKLLEDIHHKLVSTSSDSWNPNKKGSKQRHPPFNSEELVLATRNQRTIYAQPIGNIPPVWQNILNRTVKFWKITFCLDVVILPKVIFKDIPPEGKRTNPISGIQLRSDYITDVILPSVKKRDAFAVIGFTALDLWPGGSARYVVSQTNWQERTAVWSLFRLGRPDVSDEMFQSTLRRTLKVTAHELGHLWGIGHSTKHFCLMNGANSLREAETQPLYFSPPALQLLMERANCDLKTRFSNLEIFFFQNRMTAHSSHMRKSIDLLYP